jgi:hypothetical protein
MTGVTAVALTVLAVGACSGEDKKSDPESPATSSTARTPSPTGSPSPQLKKQYEDASLTLRRGKNGDPCRPNSASLDGSSPEILKGGFAVESEPDLSIEACVKPSDEGKVSFSFSSGHMAFRATDQRDGRSCNASMNDVDAPQLKDPIPFSELKVGQRFCNTHPYDQKERVEILRVQDISSKDGEVTFAVSAWQKD